MTGSRDYPARPILGVSALIESDAGLLLIERGKPPHEGIWSLPGGVVETGETLQEAIIREIDEETGLTFQPSRLAKIVEVIRPDDKGLVQRHYVIAVFYGRSDGQDLCAADDAKSARWVHPDQVCDYPLTDGTDRIIEEILAGSVLSSSCV